MHYSVIIKFNVSDAFLNLVLRSSMMLASSMALVVIRLTDFFSTLLFQMTLRVLAIIQTKGSLNFSSRLRSSKMACCGVRLGICFLRIWRSQRGMLLLKVQRSPLQIRSLLSICRATHSLFPYKSNSSKWLQNYQLILGYGVATPLSWVWKKYGVGSPNWMMQIIFSSSK